MLGVRGMSVTQFLAVGHIATLALVFTYISQAETLHKSAGSYIPAQTIVKLAFIMGMSPTPLRFCNAWSFSCIVMFSYQYQWVACWIFSTAVLSVTKAKPPRHTLFLILNGVGLQLIKHPLILALAWESG